MWIHVLLDCGWKSDSIVTPPLIDLFLNLLAAPTKIN